MRSDPSIPATKTVMRLTTLDPGAGYITTVHTYMVAPERAEHVLDYLVRSARETVRYVPGFVSFNCHVSLDRAQIVNYGQWESREAIAGARQNPKIVALMSETAKMIDLAQVQGQVHAQSMEKVGELADKNPTETVAIIRTWLHENA